MTDERYFINPYNFVGLPNHKCVRTVRQEEQNTLSGLIRCTMKNKTDLFIPSNYRKADVNDHEILHFFHYEDGPNDDGSNCLPVVPGSEIRGVIRNVYETITNSCLSTSNDLKFTMRDDPYAAKKEGLLVFDERAGKWTLHDAKKYVFSNSIPSNERFYEGEYVSFTAQKFKNQEKVVQCRKGNKQGYYHVGEIGLKDHICECILEDRGVMRDCDPFMDTALEGYQEVLRQYSDDRINKKLKDKNNPHYGYDLVSKCFDEKKTHAVFYRKMGNGNRITGLLISPAQIGRNVMNRGLFSILETMGYMPCTETNRKNKDSLKLCPGCQLFGMVTDNSSATSHVRFTDATVVKGSSVQFDKFRTLPILATPKYSNSDMYLNLNGEKPYSKFNPDYELYKPSSRKAIIQNIKDGECQINGRKYYWHHKNSNNSYQQNGVEKNNMNKTIQPLKPGTEFEFSVYFDHISESELNTLCFALDLGGDHKHGHKIGMAKSLGLGSVEVEIKDISIHTRNIDDSEIVSDRTFKRNNSITRNFDRTVYSQLMKITGFDSVSNEIISYPYMVDRNGHRTQCDGYEWFTQNDRKRVYEESSALWEISEDNDDIVMKAHEKKMGNKKR